ncbi:MAG: hypothetical protein R2795_20815 [Saprospiraceae bacterium]
MGIDFGDMSNVAPQVFATRNALAMINELGNLITGYYTNAWIKGWAKSIDMSRPSYVRLVNPKQKYGGDTRVKRITLHSNDPQNPTYGQEYEYKLANGQSSGVAAFEPLLGLEECLFTQPVWYNPNNDGNRIIFSNEQAFHEEPLGAGLYPSAQVGYSRVIVKNLSHDSITYAQSGINVSEFYTARDFPTRFESYGARLKEYPVKVLIPFIGNQSFNNNGYSMGYAFTLNNAIYGRPKSEATYPYGNGVPQGEPVQRSVYRYKTMANNPRALDNQVVTLLKEGVKETVLLGKEVDFYIDEIEANTWGFNAGVNLNLDIQYPAFLPSWFPSFGYQENNTRYLTTNKIVFNIPVLDKVEQYKDGAKVTTQNLFYDYETGDPIVSAVINEWDSLVYTYNFPAHWTYEQMKGAATNYRAGLTLQRVNAANGIFQLNHGLPASGRIPESLLQNGDVLRFETTPGLFYVSGLDRDNNRFQLTKRDGSIPPSTVLNVSKAIIVQSGFRNLQSTRKGRIVSLEDWSDYRPVQGASLVGSIISNYNFYQPAFATKNLNLTYIPSSVQSGTLGEIRLTPCLDQMVSVNYFINPHNWQLILYFGGECAASLNLQAYQDIRRFDPSKLRFEEPVNSSNPIMRYADPGNPLDGTPFPLDFQLDEKCVECQKRDPITVLHADATEFRDDWMLNYRELESEVTDASGATLSDIANGSSNGNPYAFGMKGIWRPWRTSAYLVDRIQSGTYGQSTRIDEDGEYKEFYWFDWKSPISYNEDYNWRWVNEVTQYNVNGQSKEGRNRLDIHAASLFGYQNHLVTASASNSKTTDIAFDGFEDYAVDNFNTFTGKGHGNLQLVDNTSGRPRYSLETEGHTGRFSFNLGAGDECNTCYYKYQTTLPANDHYFEPERGQSYYISFWTRQASVTGGNTNNTLPNAKVELHSGGTLLLSLQPSVGSSPVDGWYRVDGVFTMPIAATDFELRMYQVEDDNVLIDDLRIQPFNSGMETYVYDPINYRLLATLSNQNYATFFNYDEEGNLIQTKVETEQGIKTITQNRSNIQR